MNCTECNKSKQDLQTGDYYCTQKGCLVGKQEDCKESSKINDNAESELITEMCPHCETEATVCWDVSKDGYQIFCPYCGRPIMLCSMCDARDGAVCDWEEEKGCKHSSEGYRDYFHKHMTNGWIPVEERLPEDGTYICTLDGELCGLEEPFTGMCGIEKGIWDEPDCVIAWRPLPEPYKG